jgi:1-deoxy-D-xylulose-5-phosphate reductoisomerase
MTQRLAILGSTGSIGVNALDVVSRLPKGSFRITALSADSNIKLLAEQARRFRPKIVSVGSEELAVKIKRLLPSGIKISVNREGLCETVSRSDVDIVLFAISGSSCLEPLVKAIKNKKRIALANKESLVSGGAVVMKLARKNGVRMIPIDSEHSAIFQCLDGKRALARKIYLTGSGGPLLDIPKKRFDTMPQEAILNHPKWRMGRKITVDSATMMNKGLEIIEAKWLFEACESSIEVLVHPEAIVHSMVEFVDGSIIAQLGVPDMRIPIQYALTYPSRIATRMPRLDFSVTTSLSFRSPDIDKFPCLGLAREALKKGSTHPAVLNAADEEAVRCYLEGGIRFTAIPKIIEKVLGRHRSPKAGSLSLDNITEAEEWAKEEARSLCYH